MSRRERILASGSFTSEIPHCAPMSEVRSAANWQYPSWLRHPDVQSILSVFVLSSVRVLLSKGISIHNGNYQSQWYPSHNFHPEYPGLIDNLENSTQVCRIQNNSLFNHFRDRYLYPRAYVGVSKVQHILRIPRVLQFVKKANIQSPTITIQK